MGLYWFYNLQLADSREIIKRPILLLAEDCTSLTINDKHMTVCKNPSHNHIMARKIKVKKYGKTIKVINLCK